MLTFAENMPSVLQMSTSGIVGYEERLQRIRRLVGHAQQTRQSADDPIEFPWY